MVTWARLATSAENWNDTGVSRKNSINFSRCASALRAFRDIKLREGVLRGFRSGDIGYCVRVHCVRTRARRGKKFDIAR